MFNKNRLPLVGAALFGAVLISAAFADGWDPTSQAPNMDSIAKSRHNLTVSYSTYGTEMNSYRNDYREICVYCHTPHGANR